MPKPIVCPETDFLACADEHGFILGELPIHTPGHPVTEFRCPTKDKPHRKNAYGNFGRSEDGKTAALFLFNHRLKEGLYLVTSKIDARSAKKQAFYDGMSYAFRAALAAHEKSVARKLGVIFAKAEPFGIHDNCPYLERRGLVPGPGVRHINDLLYIPYFHDESNRLAFVQWINAKGQKFGAQGGTTRHVHHTIEGFPDCKAPYVLITEGYATGLAVWMATHATTIVAFDCSNLPSAAKYARDKYPNLQIVICADDDKGTEQETGKNPGREMAETAAAQVQCHVALPILGE